jgi:hypothetical protein
MDTHICMYEYIYFEYTCLNRSMYVAIGNKGRVRYIFEKVSSYFSVVKDCHCMGLSTRVSPPPLLRLCFLFFFYLCPINLYRALKPTEVLIGLLLWGVGQFKWPLIVSEKIILGGFY